ncbi:MAG: Nucleolar protein 58, partial [Paramarteilia canceri]
LKMKEFLSFEDNKEALKFSQKLEKGKITKKFKKSFKKLAKTYKDIEFATDNMKLASALSKKFKANCLYNELSSELIRKVGENFNEIDETIAKQNDIAQMGLGY